MKRVIRSLMAVLMAGVLMLGMAGCDATTNVDYNDAKTLARSGDSYSRVNYSQTKTGGKITLSGEKFAGMDTLWKYRADEGEEAGLSYTLGVGQGKVKLVFINPDGEVITLVECQSEDGQGTSKSGECPLPIREGENRIKLVGEDNSEDVEAVLDVYHPGE